MYKQALDKIEHNIIKTMIKRQEFNEALLDQFKDQKQIIDANRHYPRPILSLLDENYESDMAIESNQNLRELAECRICYGLNQDLSQPTVCSLCDKALCQSCKDKYEPNKSVCPFCQKGPYLPRKISNIEKESLQNLKFKCIKEYCKDKEQFYNQEQFVQHLKDHDTGKYLYECPVKCGETLNCSQILSHLPDFQQIRCLKTYLSRANLCKNMKYSCSKCDQEIDPKKYQEHMCILNAIKEGYYNFQPSDSMSSSLIDVDSSVDLLPPLKRIRLDQDQQISSLSQIVKVSRFQIDNPETVQIIMRDRLINNEQFSNRYAKFKQTNLQTIENEEKFWVEVTRLIHAGEYEKYEPPNIDQQRNCYISIVYFYIRFVFQEVDRENSDGMVSFVPILLTFINYKQHFENFE